MRRILAAMTGCAMALLPVAVLPVAVLPAAATAAPSAAPTPSLTVSQTALPASGAISVTVEGRGYLVPPHAAGVDVFGGVYVTFGWIGTGDSWGPAEGGVFGTGYAYPDSDMSAERQDDGSGLLHLISFTGSGTSAETTDYHMDADGSWTTALTIPGPTFTWTDPATHQAHDVDCRTVQCGVFTMGAHGKPSVTNELFVPVSFAATATSGGGIATWVWALVAAVAVVLLGPVILAVRAHRERPPA